MQLLQQNIIPAAATLHPSEQESNFPHNILWSQHDGPRLHCLKLRNYYFLQQTDYQASGNEWPERCPDLPPLDYFLWIYRPNNIEDL